MSIRVILAFHLKADVVDDMTTTFREVLPDTRAFEGCEDISILQSQEDPHLLVILEQWDTRENYDAYYTWRTETGAIALINSQCTRPLEPQLYTFVRV
jgi:quinol monooxygenase YgiN